MITKLSTSILSDKVALPWELRLAEILKRKNAQAVPFGFSNSTQHYTIKSIHSNLAIECFVRLFEGKIACIVLRYPPNAENEAHDIFKIILDTFPKEKIIFEKMQPNNALQLTVYAYDLTPQYGSSVSVYCS